VNDEILRGGSLGGKRAHKWSSVGNVGGRAVHDARLVCVYDLLDMRQG